MIYFCTLQSKRHAFIRPIHHKNYDNYDIQDYIADARYSLCEDVNIISWYYLQICAFITTCILTIWRQTYAPCAQNVEFLGAFAKLRRAIISFALSVCLSVRPTACNNSAPNGRISMKFDIWVFFENLSRQFNLHKNLTRITGTLHKDQYTFMIIFRLIILRMRNVSDKIYRKTQNTHFVFNNFFR